MNTRWSLAGHAGRFALIAIAVSWATSASASKIACVGDSITYGYNLTNPSKESYPAVLQTLLGAQHTVQNFGSSGCTLLKKGDKPYWNDAQFSASDAFKPDVVIVMLGTNDAKPQNWSRKAEFAGDYASLIDHYSGLGALVYVGVPPPVFPPGAFEIDPAVLNTEIVPLVRQIAATANAPLVDVYEALSGKSTLFPDTVHPNAEGAKLIAQTVAAALQLHGYGGALGSGGAAAIGGSSGAGGVTSNGGSAGSGGTKSVAGAPGSGGLLTTGGAFDTGGRSGPLGNGGTGGFALGSGGSTRATGGAPQSSGGTKNTGGTPSSTSRSSTQGGQSSGAGGAETGGAGSLGGTSSAGTTTSIIAAGGTAPTRVTTSAVTSASSGGGSGLQSGVGGVQPETQPPDSNGCACRIDEPEHSGSRVSPLLWLALLHLARTRVKRRGRG